MVEPNTESLSSHTTASVVTAITVVILADAVFAIATRSIRFWMNLGASSAVVSLRGITTRFGHNVVHENLDLDIACGEIVALMGSSG